MNELTPHNHDLMKLVKARVDADYPMTFIAQELGVHVDELCEWVLKVYKEPKPHKSKPYTSRDMPAIGFALAAKDHYSAGKHAQRFANWRKQQEGAAATRRMLEMSHE